MQTVGADIPPIPIQPHLPGRSPGPRRLEHALRDPQPRVRRHHFRARHPLRHFAPLTRRQGPAIPAMDRVHRRDVLARPVGEGFGGSQVRGEGAVAGQYVEFGRGGGGRVGRVGPGPRVRCRVIGCEREGAEGDADVEVGEDELDAGDFFWSELVCGFEGKRGEAAKEGKRGKGECVLF